MICVITNSQGEGLTAPFRLKDLWKLKHLLGFLWRDGSYHLCQGEKDRLGFMSPLIISYGSLDNLLTFPRHWESDAHFINLPEQVGELM